MTTLLFANNATTTLAAPITASSTSVVVSSNVFPNPAAQQAFIATIIKNGNTSLFEIVLCTANSSGILTITRGYEGTSAQSWSAGDTISMLPTAGTMGNFVQPTAAQAQNSNYSADTGSVNSYFVDLSPALTNGHIIGMPIRWIAGTTNTGACNFNDGAGGAPLVLWGASGLVHIPAAFITVGSFQECFYDGTYFQLLCPNLSDYVTEAQLEAAINPGSSILGSAWWRKNPDGSIDQGGIFNGAAGINTVTLNQGYTHGLWSVLLTPVNTTVTPQWQTSGSKTNFIMVLTGNAAICWRAFGY